jgi:hypothetical protein
MDKSTEQEQDNIAEFCDIIRQLVDRDLAVLHQVLLIEDEKEQFKCLRQLRDKITFYGNLYNAYSARVLVQEPIIYVKNEIVSRFNACDEVKNENHILREMVMDQGGKLNRAIFAIFQLHDGLFNHATQPYMLQLSNAKLFDTDLPEEPKEEYDIYPTTRQGDEHEERFKKLEETLRNLEEKIDAMDKRQRQVIFTI